MREDEKEKRGTMGRETEIETEMIFKFRFNYILVDSYLFN